MNRPKEWKEGTLDDLCELKQDTCLPVESGSDFYVGLEHVESGRFSIRSNGKPEQVMSAKSRFEANNVLYGKLRPYLDKAVVADKNGICSTDILVLSPKVGIPSFYLAGLLHSDLFIQHAIQTTHGVNHPRTSWKAIKDFRTIIPPLPEQRKIAAVLFRIQKAIELQEAIIERTRELKKAAMQFVFTHGLRGEKTKETEIGRIPESWEIKTIASLFQMKQGKSLSARKRTGEHLKPFLRTANVFWGQLNLSCLDEMDILPSEREALRLRYGDLLVCEGGDIGRTAVWKEEISECYYQNHLHRLRRKDGNVNPFFFMYWMETAVNLRGAYGTFGNRTTIPNLSGARLSNFQVPFPGLTEQNNIEEVIAILDRKIILNMSKKSALQALFKTTLNKLMSGEIRVRDLEIDCSRL